MILHRTATGGIRLFHKIIEFVKAHPYGIAAGVFGVGILYLILHRSSGGSTDSTAADLSAEAQLQQAGAEYQAQMGAQQTQQQQISAAQDVANEQTAASVQNSTINANQNVDIAQLTAQTSQLTAALSAQTTTAVSTLQAQVADAQTAASVSINQNNNQALVAVATAPYTAAVTETGLNDATAVQLAQINSQNVSATELTGLEEQIQGLGSQISNINAAWQANWGGGPGDVYNAAPSTAQFFTQNPVTATSPVPGVTPNAPG